MSNDALDRINVNVNLDDDPWGDSLPPLPAEIAVQEMAPPQEAVSVDDDPWSDAPPPLPVEVPVSKPPPVAAKPVVETPKKPPSVAAKPVVEAPVAEAPEEVVVEAPKEEPAAPEQKPVFAAPKGVPLGETFAQTMAEADEALYSQEETDFSAAYEQGSREGVLPEGRNRRLAAAIKWAESNDREMRIPMEYYDIKTGSYSKYGTPDNLESINPAELLSNLYSERQSVRDQQRDIAAYEFAKDLLTAPDSSKFFYGDTGALSAEKGRAKGQKEFAYSKANELIYQAERSYQIGLLSKKVGRKLTAAETRSAEAAALNNLSKNISFGQSYGMTGYPKDRLSRLFQQDQQRSNREVGDVPKTSAFRRRFAEDRLIQAYEYSDPDRAKKTKNRNKLVKLEAGNLLLQSSPGKKDTELVVLESQNVGATMARLRRSISQKEDLVAQLQDIVDKAEAAGSPNLEAASRLIKLSGDLSDERTKLSNMQQGDMITIDVSKAREEGSLLSLYFPENLPDEEVQVLVQRINIDRPEGMSDEEYVFYVAGLRADNRLRTQALERDIEKNIKNISLNNTKVQNANEALRELDLDLASRIDASLGSSANMDSLGRELESLIQNIQEGGWHSFKDAATAAQKLSMYTDYFLQRKNLFLSYSSDTTPSFSLTRNASQAGSYKQVQGGAFGAGRSVVEKTVFDSLNPTAQGVLDDWFTRFNAAITNRESVYNAGKQDAVLSQQEVSQLLNNNKTLHRQILQKQADLSRIRKASYLPEPAGD
jgi:hypothetical protein